MTSITCGCAHTPLAPPASSPLAPPPTVPPSFSRQNSRVRAADSSKSRPTSSSIAHTAVGTPTKTTALRLVRRLARSPLAPSSRDVLHSTLTFGKVARSAFMLQPPLPIRVPTAVGRMRIVTRTSCGRQRGWRQAVRVRERGEAEEQRSRGAKDQRNRGAEEHRGTGRKELSCSGWRRDVRVRWNSGARSSSGARNVYI